LLGCATKTSVEQLQAQIDPIKYDVRELHKATTSAKYAVERANMRADKAYIASKLALQINQELNERVTSEVNK